MRYVYLGKYFKYNHSRINFFLSSDKLPVSDFFKISTQKKGFLTLQITIIIEVR